MRGQLTSERYPVQSNVIAHGHRAERDTDHQDGLHFLNVAESSIKTD